jgi:hypothetical protein
MKLKIVSRVKPIWKKTTSNIPGTVIGMVRPGYAIIAGNRFKIQHMKKAKEDPLLKLRRRFSGNEQYNLLLTAYTQLQNDTKADAANLKDLRKIHAALEKEHEELQKMLQGKAVVSEKTYLKVLKEYRNLQIKHQELEEKYYDIIREKNHADAEELRKELDKLRM